MKVLGKDVQGRGQHVQRPCDPDKLSMFVAQRQGKCCWDGEAEAALQDQKSDWEKGTD